MSPSGSIPFLGTKTSRPAKPQVKGMGSKKNVLGITRNRNGSVSSRDYHFHFHAWISMNPGYVLTIDLAHLLHHGGHYSSPTRCCHLAGNVTESERGWQTRGQWIPRALIYWHTRSAVSSLVWSNALWNALTVKKSVKPMEGDFGRSIVGRGG